jgi:2-iminoacetate synthase ThiH
LFGNLFVNHNSSIPVEEALKDPMMSSLDSMLGTAAESWSNQCSNKSAQENLTLPSGVRSSFQLTD